MIKWFPRDIIQIGYILNWTPTLTHSIRRCLNCAIVCINKSGTETVFGHYRLDQLGQLGANIKWHCDHVLWTISGLSSSDHWGRGGGRGSKPPPPRGDETIGFTVAKFDLQPQVSTYSHWLKFAAKWRNSGWLRLFS